LARARARTPPPAVPPPAPAAAAPKATPAGTDDVRPGAIEEPTPEADARTVRHARTSHRVRFGPNKAPLIE
jgi:hypothetical protein